MTRPLDSNAIAIARYLSGESTVAESALVEAWIASDPRNRAEFAEIRRAWSASFPLERPIDLDGAWSRVATEMRRSSGDKLAGDADAIDHRATSHTPLRLEQQQPVRSASGFRSSRSKLWPSYRVARVGSSRRLQAAAIALLLFGAAGVYRQISSRSTERTDDDRTTREFVAAAGQRALIDLEDGTHIVLAPSTHLTVSMPKHGAGIRDVVLDGEAMFSVTHDSARPFVVRSRYGSTMDLGTAFAVRAYANDTYRVAVREGEVAMGRSSLSSTTQKGSQHHSKKPSSSDSRNDSGATEFIVDRTSPVLVAGDVATRDDDGRMEIKHHQDVAELLDWSSGRLTFDHKRFSELVPELERWYGVRIKIASASLRDRSVTGQFDTESRSEAFDALGRALGARHTVDGSRVTFFLP